MLKDELRDKLDEGMDTFEKYAHSLDPDSHRPVTEGELSELAKQTFYALAAIRDCIAEMSK